MQIIVVNQQKEQRYEVIENSKRVTKLDYLGKLQKIFQFTGFYWIKNTGTRILNVSIVNYKSKFIMKYGPRYSLRLPKPRLHI